MLSLSLYIFFNIENNIYKNRSIADYIAQIFSDFLFREAHLSQSLFSAATWFLEDQQDDFSNVGNVHKGHHEGENLDFFVKSVEFNQLLTDQMEEGLVKYMKLSTIECL